MSIDVPGFFVAVNEGTHLRSIYKIALSGCLAVLAATGPSHAKDRLIKCDLKRLGTRPGTPSEVAISYVNGAERMVVYDIIMAGLDMQPMLGKVGRDTDKTLVLRWTLEDVKDSIGNVFDVRYSLNWSKNTGQANITGRISFADDHYVGTGKCYFKK